MENTQNVCRFTNVLTCYVANTVKVHEYLLNVTTALARAVGRAKANQLLEDLSIKGISDCKSQGLQMYGHFLFQ